MSNPHDLTFEGDGLAERRRFLAAAGALACAGFSTVVAGPQVAEAAEVAGQVDLAVFPKKRLGAGDVLRPEKTALIIVDMINRFCDAKWMSGGSEEGAKRIAADLKVIIASIRETLDAFRERGALVVHVVNAKWTRDGRDVVSYQRGRDYDLFDTPAMSVIDELRPLPGEIVTRKVASSSFTGTGLDFLLKNAGIENVVLCGQFGNACVFYTLIQSREFGFSNVWLEDGILYGGDVYKRVFEALVGSMWAKLATGPELIRALAPA